MRKLFDVETIGDAVWCTVIGLVLFACWPLVLCFIIPALGPWGSLERRRVAEIGAKLALVTVAWCACASACAILCARMGWV